MVCSLQSLLFALSLTSFFSFSPSSLLSLYVDAFGCFCFSFLSLVFFGDLFLHFSIVYFLFFLISYRYFFLTHLFPDPFSGLLD